MTNQEVNEYMQRFLDEDLNESELEALMEHIRQSPASAALFDRLQRLDTELDQLPKVVPPMSIVDSILPRLELAGLMDQAPMTDTVSTDNLSNHVIPLARRVPLRERINFRLMSGVIAAGIVLTLFFTDLGPQMSFQTANDDTAALDDISMNTSMASKSDAKMSKESAAIQSAPNDEQGGSINEATEAEDPTLSITFAEPALPESDVNEPMANDIAEVPTPWVDNGNVLEDNIINDDMEASNKGLVATETPTDSDSVGTVAPSDSGAAAASVEEPSSERIMVTATQLLPSVVSPNEQLTGTVTAVAEGGQQIIITDLSGNQVYQSAVYQGTLDQLTWSPDSTQLHFEVNVDNASTVHMTINIIALTEALKILE